MYNTLADIGFTLVHKKHQYCTVHEFFCAIMRRLQNLAENPDEINEAVGMVDEMDHENSPDDVKEWAKTIPGRHQWMVNLYDNGHITIHQIQ